METNEFRDLLELPKQNLEDYLVRQGVEIHDKGRSKMFKCINPDHDDNNPSCGIVPETDGKLFHCLGCGAAGDIYTAAAYLEDKPMHGLEFIKENVEYVLDLFSIDYEPIELSDEQLSRFRYEGIYEAAVKMLSEVNDEGGLEFVTLEHTQARNWKEHTVLKLGIATVKDYDKFIDVLAKRTSLRPSELYSAGITDKLFGPNYITFTIRNHAGKAVGFVARDIKWKKGSLDPKYRNTSIDQNPFYRKDSLLYGLYNSKKLKDMRLDIFEGYGSYVTAYQNNYRNCCSLGGTALTENHIELLKDLGYKYINLVLDGDKTGQDNMDKYLEKFSGHGLEVTTTRLDFSDQDLSQPGCNDPEYYINTYGIDAYRAQKPVSVFAHMLAKSKQFDVDDPGAVDFCRKIIPMIIDEPDILRRGQMAKALSAHTHVDLDDIKLQIETTEKQDITKSKKDMMRRLERTNNPDQISQILENFNTDLEEKSSTKKDKYLVSLGETIETFDNIFVEMNKAPQGIHGWATGYEPLDAMLDGIPRPGVGGGRAIGFAGAAQHGKSAAMLNIALQVALNNNDVSILYWAIDDHRKAIAYRLIATLADVPMRKVMNNEKRDADEDRRIKEAQDILRALISDQKLVFKDDKFGRSKTRAKNWIEHTQQETSNEILFCVDSLHNVSGDDGQEARTKIMGTSTWLKNLVASVPATVMATIELVKNRVAGAKPTLQSISESVKIEFDFDSVAIVWNEAQGNYTNVEAVQAKWQKQGVWHPVIELDFQKNKSGAGEKGSVYFLYDKYTTKFVDCRSVMKYDNDPVEVISDSGTTYSIKPATKDEPEELSTWE